MVRALRIRVNVLRCHFFRISELISSSQVVFYYLSIHPPQNMGQYCTRYKCTMRNKRAWSLPSWRLKCIQRNNINRYNYGKYYFISPATSVMKESALGTYERPILPNFLGELNEVACHGSMWHILCLICTN